MSMPGKQARVLCPVCQEPIPPDETECENCGAFVIDEAVVRLSRALGLDRDRALKLFEAGFRHPTQLRDRDPNRVLEKGEVGLLFICTNCGGFVAGADTKCPRCAAEFESEPESPAAAEEEDILDLVLCPVCGADNEPALAECEICGEALRPPKEPVPAAAPAAPATPPSPAPIVEEDWVLESIRDSHEDRERLPEPPRAAVPAKGPPGRAQAGAPPAPAATTAKAAPVVREPPRPWPAVPAAPAKAPAKTTSPLPPAPKPSPAELRGARPLPMSKAPPKPAVSSKMDPRRTNRPAIHILTPTVPPPPLQRRRAPPKVPAAATKRAKRIAQKRVRAPPRSGLNAETTAGFVVAACAGLLLAGILRQPPVGLGIAASLVVLDLVVVLDLIRGAIRRPSRFDGILLALSAALGLPAAILPGSLALEGTVLALMGAANLAWLTRRLLRTPPRILLPVAAAVPLIGHGIAGALNPSYPTTLPWLIGIAAALPWPAALAATEIHRRRSASMMRHQVARAEQNMARKDYERSLAEYDRAIARTAVDIPGAEVPWYGKGATLILLGRYEEAVRAIDKALDINPRNEVAWVNKGNALTRMGQLIDALRCFNAAIKVNALYEVAWNNKGNALARLGKLDEALRCYERALGIDPGYRGAWVNMGFVLTKLGRFDEAASCADHAKRLQPGRRAEPT